MKRLLFLIITALFFQLTIYAQGETLVNKKWEYIFGTPNDFEWAASVFDNEGNLITTGHSTLDTANTALLLVKQSGNGTILWQKEFQISPNTKNGGISLAIDINNKIYVTGVTSTSNNFSDFDFLVLKFDNDGTNLWHQSFNGAGNGVDIPVSILTKQSGVFIGGTSKGINTGRDYWALKLNASNGNLLWQKRYDFAGLDDYPTGMILDDSGNLVLTGVSAENTLNWKVATLKYDESSGVLLNEKRLGNGTTGFSQPSAITKDASGNVIVSGITTTDGVSFDIRTIKLTSNLDLEWIQDYDSGAEIDSVSAIVCGLDGSINITGWRSNPQGGTEFQTLKYKPNGNLLWVNNRTVNPSGVLSKSRVIGVNAEGETTIAGSSKNKIIITHYNSSGIVIWEKEIKTPSVDYNKPLALRYDENNSIYITSILKIGNEKSYATYKIKTLERLGEYVYDQQGEASHIKGEIIVRFKPNVIKQSFIDDTSLRYGTLGKIFSDSLCLDAIGKALSANEIEKWVAIKIHRNMTTADSIAITRLGKTISIPDFYNTFVLLVPEKYDAIKEEYKIIEALNEGITNDLFPCLRYAESNPVVSLDDCGEPNDPRYYLQANLYPRDMYPNGHINMEPAWCIAEGDNTNIKVSIIDSGVRWSHEDFGNGTFEGSVFVGGKDYATGSEDISSNNGNDEINHGTKVAGIVGAIRNNERGIAGIAGGDNNGNGVRMIIQRAFIGGSDILIEAFEDAVNEYDVQLINCSGGFTPSNPPIGTSLAMREKLHFANRMGVVICASRGNDGSSTPRYPGTAQDEWVLCVGGTNVEGNYNPDCRIGFPIDIAAPSRWELVRTTQSHTFPGNIPSDTAYGGFSFTSAAAPHATGLAALMMSYYESTGTNLVQEDVEYIIQASATDVILDPAEPGYDDQTGFGRVNAGAALEMIERPNCNVFHFGTDASQHTKTNELIEENISLELTEPFTTEAGETFDRGTYTTDVYKVSATVTHDLPSNLSPTHHWERHSSSTVFKLYETLDGQKKLQPVENVKFTNSPTSNSATLEGYVYYLEGAGWIPSAPEDAELTYSMIGCIMTGTEEVVGNSLQLYPNPTAHELNISIPEDMDRNFSVASFYDFSGKEIFTFALNGHNFKDDVITFDISHFPSGIYTCVLLSKEKTFTAKFIKL